MRNNKFTPRNAVEVPTTELYLVAVVNRTECANHDARFGEPCFQAIRPKPYLTRGSGVCNKRALDAGMRHAIRPESLRLNRQNKGKKK